MHSYRWSLPFLMAVCLPASWPAHAAAADPSACTSSAATDCLRSFTPAGAGGALHYYSSLAPDAPTATTGPTKALIAMHGHSRDANKTFEATLRTVRNAGALDDTLVVAPLFQVPADKAASRCNSPGLPAPQPGDLLWTCGSWLEGGRSASGSRIGSFAVMDALVAELVQRWPSLRTVTIAGFSAGGQFAQRYAAFAQNGGTAGKVAMRYVVADPSTWLYFDPVRPQLSSDGASVSGFAVPDAAACPEMNRWKYGTDDLPAHLGRSAAQARRQYAEADISYLEGELDSNDARGTAYRVLDKSCAAAAQGPFRLQRGLAYAQYDRTLLAPAKRREVVVVPGCAHDVACVFPSEAARAALIGPPR
ncbi:hypothetical protein SAMN05518669_10149 [Variovorax sp. YR634]|uniref:hypothetical protein n=1 Tax=unclassified Variovorax TaxID=663243 RepID=UPI0008964107|nr:MULTISPECIES: hypothetical protein [unclassified Variovorax]SDW13745.1 hypothetical protein SAMN05518669_10149 [Variovorax sp. YR634]SDY30360.1 hypothetical protein SAMN05518854_101739 [Variovorax sp. YR266]